MGAVLNQVLAANRGVDVEHGVASHGELPSVFIQVGTDYSKLHRNLQNEVDRFYDKYPPYFSHYN